MNYERGDVVWSDDPFKDDSDAGRPWLVVNTDAHPFDDEQHMAVALSTSGYEATLPISDIDWIDGGCPTKVMCFRGRRTHPRTGSSSFAKVG